MKSYIVIFLTLAVSGLNFLYGILNTRFLGLEEIGIYSLLIQSINTIVLISDLGLSTAFLKFYSITYTKDKNEGNNVLRNSFYLKSMVSGILILLFLLFYSFIKKYLGENVNNKQLLLMFTTLFTISISELLMSRYRAEGRFKTFFIYKFLMAFLRIIPMALFYYFGKYNLDSSISIFVYSTLFIVFVLLIEQKEIFKKFSFDKVFINELFHFSKWIFVSNIALAFIMNGTSELYLLKTFSDKKELGYFSAILIFFTILNVLNTSLTTLFFPKFAGCEDNEKLKIEVKKAFKIGIILALPLLLLIPFMDIFIKLTIGESFLGVEKLANILMFVFFIELSSQVFRLVLYIRANKKIALINSLQFLGSLILGFLFIGVLRMGAFGAVISIFIVRLSGAFYMWQSYKKAVNN